MIKFGKHAKQHHTSGDASGKSTLVSYARATCRGYVFGDGDLVLASHL